MRWLFGPRNSVIIAYDQMTQEGLERFREELDEIGRYYRFCKLGEIVGDLKRGKARGRAAVVFKNARKSVLMLAVRELVSRELPFTLMLRPDCIGLNRLPPEEELRHYRDAYPDRLSDKEWGALSADIVDNRARVESFLSGARKTLGPLPVENIDPMGFFSTWGKILEVSPRFREIGLFVDGGEREGHAIQQAMRFVAGQVGEEPRLAYHPGAAPCGWLAALGFAGVLVDKQGFVDASTDPYALPIWPLSSS